ncbi:LPS assembly lipoprotein LptE, partial [Thaumasiovibrio sp. DFM-14]|uniref:LPS-assembly lipoprotein LptE n=1 Tax=Thaumasiovibrio sp. DFM-14 TaxID=3384792 RepID=UPI0039A195FE
VTTLYRLSLIGVFTLLLTACGFQLRSTSLLPEELSEISVSSYDRFGSFRRIMEHQLTLAGISTVPAHADIPHLRIIREGLSEHTLSLYQNSRKAEYALSMRVSYAITVPGKGTLNLTTQVNRTFLDNPQTALAKSVERDMVRNEMREQAASQIVRQLARVNRLYDERGAGDVSELNQEDGFNDDANYYEETGFYEETEYYEAID